MVHYYKVHRRNNYVDHVYGATINFTLTHVAFLDADGVVVEAFRSEDVLRIIKDHSVG